MLIAQAVDMPGFEPIQAVVMPIQFTMLLAGIIGAISVTGEYSTGMIRSTLAAVPVRGIGARREGRRARHSSCSCRRW